jgi:hypothetical protein
VGKCVVDARGGRIVGIGEIYAGRQHGRGDVAVDAQPARGAVVGALGQWFGHPGPAEAVLFGVIVLGAVAVVVFLARGAIEIQRPAVREELT